MVVARPDPPWWLLVSVVPIPLIDSRHSAVIDVGFKYNLDEIACGDKSKNGIYNDINGASQPIGKYT